MCRPINWIANHAQAIISVGSVLFAILAWFFMMSGIPDRVGKLEQDVAELKTNLATQNTKLDMIVNSVYEIRAVLLKGK